VADLEEHVAAGANDVQIVLGLSLDREGNLDRVRAIVDRLAGMGWLGAGHFSAHARLKPRKENATKKALADARAEIEALRAKLNAAN